MSELTYEQVKKDAAQIQDACNPIAVANYLARASRVVSDEFKGFDKMRQDPYLKAIVGKLCDMFNIDHDGSVYDVLYNEEK